MDIVADTIDEKVGSRAYAAEDDRVAMAFTLRHVHTWCVIDDVADAVKAPDRDVICCGDRQALWHVDDWSWCFKGVDLICVERVADNHGFVDCHFGGGCGLRGLSRDCRDSKGHRKRSAGQSFGSVRFHL